MDNEHIDTLHILNVPPDWLSCFLINSKRIMGHWHIVQKEIPPKNLPYPLHPKGICS